jgi:hypothetical protein
MVLRIDIPIDLEFSRGSHLVGAASTWRRTDWRQQPDKQQMKAM